jgi:hypothetical protein
MGGAVSKMIERNSTIPCSHTEGYTTYADNQTGLDLNTLQGDNLGRAIHGCDDRVHGGHVAGGGFDVEVGEAGAAGDQVDAAFFEQGQFA